jgi:hypothetical protein
MRESGVRRDRVAASRHRPPPLRYESYGKQLRGVQHEHDHRNDRR